MEVDEKGGVVSVEVEKKNSPEEEPKVKRKMKTPSQLEILEKTYAMETYPSEAVRAELSVKLGLSDRQLQMWFCHRRLKDQKAPTTEKRQKKNAADAGGIAHETVVNSAEVAKEYGSSLSLSENMDLKHKQKQKQKQQRVVHKVGTAVPRLSTELPLVRRFYEPPLAVSEQRAIKFVEAQLGEPLRDDSPILGMEFEPLPPGAFGAPIVTSEQQKQPGGSYDAHLYERLDAKQIKGGASRALLEYQFLPEKPSAYARSDAYERAVPPHYYGSPTDILNARVRSPTGVSVIRGNENVSCGYLQGQLPNLSLLPQPARQDLHLSPAPGEVDVTRPVPSMVNPKIDSHHLVHPIGVSDDQVTTPDRHIILDQERLERKRKAEEAIITKEVEAHEKRIRKELEKQDVLRRKREEQMRKEMERQDRERRKEEERLLREKQREEERYQREQRREMERREKFLQKEYIRAEKMRLKEEMRKEKEAARLKASNDRAAARRIAKESMELIEDEKLELMELAALSRGLPSILALDCETLQSLDLFKDKLPEFPPESVNLKRPFGFRPWTDSEDNVGKLLMVWRFLIAFADVLGLWPFTLDELAQALHDCDPRLLGEIHMALLRSIIKDIECVAKTSATAIAANQSSACIPAGGHPHIVEGAYAWGFDLLSWQRLLSPLTWPEILRQFALSAGVGPKLKQRNTKSAYRDDESEGGDGADTISNLRSGVAAENAVAIMQERGFSNPRRSRHRLTPGTVKYAAFHVLSLDGSKGLSILDVADRIQKSGLRDLTTSNTPEASISAALSRDTKLFERTAPSTYCVRSPYRKDPAQSEVILSEAREQIRVYQNGSVDEEVEDVEKEDVERDQDSESDDPDVNDLDAVAKLKEASHSSESSRSKNVRQYGKENFCMESPLATVGNTKSSPTLTQSVDYIKINGTGVPNVDVSGINSQTAIDDLGNTVIDDCGSGEPWVQGLTEGEYADLSTEDRLDVLVALISIANEGNAIRIALEERLEAANALKKQMWAETKLDKRRMKEEPILKLQHSSLAGSRTEQNLSNFMVEQRRSPLTSAYWKHKLSFSTNPALQLVDLNDEQNDCNDFSNTITERNSSMQDISAVSDNLLLQQSVYAAEKSRPELKAFIGHQAEDIYVYRSLPLGQDRRRNRYWQFITSPSQNDPGSGRIFVELRNGVWRIIDSEEGFSALLSSMDVRGIRESHLHSMLQNIGSSFKGTARKNLLCSGSSVHVHDEVKKVLETGHKLDLYSHTDSAKSTISISYSNSLGPSKSFSFELGNNEMEENDIMEKYKDFEWMWKECFDSNVLGALKYGTLRCQRLLDICNRCHSLFSWEDNHCPSCHRTCCISEKTFNFSEHITQCQTKQSEEFHGVLLNLSLPPRIRLLKVQLAAIEASIPSDALESFWSDEYRKSWGRKLHMASTAEELLQSLALLEDSIKRDFLSANYETTSEILCSSKALGSYSDALSRTEAAVLPWIPRTTPAVALRLKELDASIYYSLHQKAAQQNDNEAGYFIKLPSIYSSLGSSIDNLQQDNCWADLGNGNTMLKRGRGRPRGPSGTRAGKSQRKVIKSRDGSLKLATRKDKIPAWKGRSRARGNIKKGRRSIRSRQKPISRETGNNNVVEKSDADNIVFFDDTTGLEPADCDFAETPMEKIEGAEYVCSSENSEFENDDGQAPADEYDDLLVGDFTASTHEMGKKEEDERIEDGDDGGDVNFDDDDDGDDSMDEREYFYGENQFTGGEQAAHVDPSADAGSASSLSSSEYSY